MSKGGVFSIITGLAGNQNKVITEKLFIDFMDDLAAGAMLSQLVYWSSRTRIKEGWIAKTYEEWYDEIRLKRGATIRAKKKLEEKGILEAKAKRFNGKVIVHYRLNKVEFIKQITDFTEKTANKANLAGSTETERSESIETVFPESTETVRSESIETVRSLTETTTKIKTEREEEALSFLKNELSENDNLLKDSKQNNTTPTPITGGPPPPDFSKDIEVFVIHYRQDGENMSVILPQIKNLISNQQFNVNEWPNIAKHIPEYFKRTVKHNTAGKGEWRRKAYNYIKNQEWLTNPNPEKNALKVCPAPKKMNRGVCPAPNRYAQYQNM